MNKFKRTYLFLSVILLFGTFFTLGFSNASNNADSDLINQPSYSIKPGFNGGVGWVVGDSLGDGYGVILHTTDGGKNWVRQGSPGEIPDVDLVTVSAIDACNAWVAGGISDGFGVILRTTDGGRNWIRQGSIDQIPDGQISAIYAINKQIAWAAGFEFDAGGDTEGDGVILHTKDGGRTWTRQAQDLTPNANLQGVYASDASHVWVVGDIESPCPDDMCGNILHSTNGGRTWKQQIYPPSPGNIGGYLISVHGLNAKTAWAVGNGAVVHTTDGGETWQNKTPLNGGGLYDWNGVFAVNKNTVWVARDNDGVFKYDGSQWHTYSLPPLPGNLFYHLLRASAIDPHTVWITGNSPPNSGVILYTDTGGENWEVQDPGLDTGFWGVSFVKSGFCNSNR
jgi:photosystem II stability/assembly factor-like uncharacterized protein